MLEDWKLLSNVVLQGIAPQCAGIRYGSQSKEVENNSALWERRVQLNNLVGQVINQQSNNTACTPHQCIETGYTSAM